MAKPVVLQPLKFVQETSPYCRSIQPRTPSKPKTKPTDQSPGKKKYAKMEYAVPDNEWESIRTLSESKL